MNVDINEDNNSFNSDGVMKDHGITELEADDSSGGVEKDMSGNVVNAGVDDNYNNEKPNVEDDFGDFSKYCCKIVICRVSNLCSWKL